MFHNVVASFTHTAITKAFMWTIALESTDIFYLRQNIHNHL